MVNSKKSESKRKSVKKVKKHPKKYYLTPEEEASLKEDLHKRSERLTADLEEMIRLSEEHADKQSKELIRTFFSLGYVFKPSEVTLVDYYLRNKNLNKSMEFCPIVDADVYTTHPQNLTENSEVQYFFTRGRPDENPRSADVQGHWIFGKRKYVYKEDEKQKKIKIGVKQVFEHCEEDVKSGYKIIEYQLVRTPDSLMNGLWFVCRLSYCDAKFKLLS